MKKACVALIQDVAKAPEHLEALPKLFDCAESVRWYAENFLNSRVTIVVEILDVEVADEVKLLSGQRN